jgi:putative oxidoreductase
MMLVNHGWPKLSGFAGKMTSFPDPLGLSSPVSLALAVFAEFFCSLAILLGWHTRWAAVPLVITMLVAAFVVHADDPWHKKEFALLYAAPLATMILTGAGRYSIDYLRKPRSSR